MRFRYLPASLLRLSTIKEMTKSGSFSSCPAMEKSPYLNNSELIAPLSIRMCKNPNSDDLNHQVYSVLKEIIPAFLEQYQIEMSSQLNVQTLSGGLSNHLLTVRPGKVEEDPIELKKSDDNAAPNTILIRIHDADGDEKSGEEEFSLVDRAQENKVSAMLSKYDLAPAFYGRFLNGRLEEFYEDIRPLSHSEMGCYTCTGNENDITREWDGKYNGFTIELAKKLSKLHQLDLENNEDQKLGEIWLRIDEWIKMARQLNANDDDNNDKAIEQMLDLLEREWSWLRAEIGPEKKVVLDDSCQSDAIRYSRDIVFAHMDCQSLNILTPKSRCEKSDEIAIIDYEYAGYNPRAADIGNSFAEFCDMNNLIPDYENEYPSDSCQNIFLSTYIRSNDSDLAKKLDDSQEWGQFLHVMRDEVGKHSLLSHLGWACWSLIQLKTSSIDFDYLRYAQIRVDGYLLFKAKHWP
ncbi:hypothetical protein CTEN210_04689 [Chaetoceros tenuissimus]|uniref:ethanolamine kinase n=1 Tax=Chaetoceros tenuissimus TaxID=426638 RepID=A0AAD3H305_9STRA|nr:hypothetical protein CTEN210_04689 [Chaetoceros tenuissimus]